MRRRCSTPWRSIRTDALGRAPGARPPTAGRAPLSRTRRGPSSRRPRTPAPCTSSRATCSCRSPSPYDHDRARPNGGVIMTGRKGRGRERCPSLIRGGRKPVIEGGVALLSAPYQNTFPVPSALWPTRPLRGALEIRSIALVRPTLPFGGSKADLRKFGTTATITTTRVTKIAREG